LALLNFSLNKGSARLPTFDRIIASFSFLLANPRFWKKFKPETKTAVNYVKESKSVRFSIHLIHG
jgi:hypothetical protein